jgi:hypothetical protein
MTKLLFFFKEKKALNSSKKKKVTQQMVGTTTRTQLSQVVQSQTAQVKTGGHDGSSAALERREGALVSQERGRQRSGSTR